MVLIKHLYQEQFSLNRHSAWKREREIERERDRKEESEIERERERENERETEREKEIEKWVECLHHGLNIRYTAWSHKLIVENCELRWWRKKTTKSSLVEIAAQFTLNDFNRKPLKQTERNIFCLLHIDLQNAKGNASKCKNEIKTKYTISISRQD